MRRRFLVVALSLSAAFGFGATAHDGAKGVVKERMDAMKTLSDAAKALGAIKAGAIPYTPRTIRRAATMIRENGEASREMFPAGTEGGASEALPVVWSEPAGFERLFNDMLAAAARMEAAAEDEAAAMAAAEDVAATCKECHRIYRKKKL